MSTEVRKAMVLAAGYGKRLRPLTVHTAKPALPLMGRPLIEYILRRLVRVGISEVVVNLHHHPDTVTRSLETAGDGLTIHRSLEPELLGTAGGLKNAAAHFTSERAFLLLNADTLVDFDLEEMLRVHRDSSASATLLLRPRPSGSAYSSVHVAPGGRIDSIATGRKNGELMFAGIWVLSPEVLSHLSGAPGGLEKELLPRLVEDGTAFACPQDATWITIDTPRRYLASCLSMARERLFEEDWNVKAVAGRGTTRAWVGSGTRIETGARLRGDVVMGERCRIAKGAHVERVLCWDRVAVPAGTKLENCVITTGVKLRPGMELTDRVVMAVTESSSGLRKREIRDDLVIAEFGNGRTRGL